MWLVSLDPTRGSEIRKTRPCVIVSPDEMNRHVQAVIVAPMTTVIRRYPTRVRVKFAGTTGEIVLDQIRTVHRTRLLHRLGSVPRAAAQRACAVLVEMFSWS